MNWDGLLMPGTTELRRYTDVGCYPIFYLSDDNSCLCNECASTERESIAAADVNWEDPALRCDGCGERIESAYAEDEAAEREEADRAERAWEDEQERRGDEARERAAWGDE